MNAHRMLVVMMLTVAALLVGVSAASAAPLNTAAPEISGTAQAGQTLTAAPGSWTGNGSITYQYEFYLCNGLVTDSDLSSCSAAGDRVQGPNTTTTWTPAATRISGRVYVKVTATDLDGSTSAVSPLTAPITGADSLYSSTVKSVGSLQKYLRLSDRVVDSVAALTETTGAETIGQYIEPEGNTSQVAEGSTGIGQVDSTDKGVFFNGAGYPFGNISSGGYASALGVSNSYGATADFTINFWLNHGCCTTWSDSSPKPRSVMSWGDSSTMNGWTVYYNESTNQLFFRRNGTVYPFPLNAQASRNLWRNIVITYDDSEQQLKFYYQGRIVRVFSNVDFDASTGTGDFYLANGTAQRGRISLDEASFYDEALDDGTILDLFDKGELADTTILAGPANSKTARTDSPTFHFSSPQKTATFECRIDGGAWTDCSNGTTPRSSYTASALSNASHTFSVRATDTNSNVDSTPASATFTVNTADTTYSGRVRGVDGLMSLYALDETSGTALNEDQNRPDSLVPATAAYTTGNTLNQTSLLTSGEGKAFIVKNNAGAYADFRDQYHTFTDGFSSALWFKPAAGSSDRVLLAGSGVFSLRLKGNTIASDADKLELRLHHSDGTATVTTSDPVRMNKISHAAFTYQPGGPGTVTLYLNGQQAGSASVSGTVNQQTTLTSSSEPRLTFGYELTAGAGGSYAVDTHLDNVAVYQRELSAGEVAADHAAGADTAAPSASITSGPAASPAVTTSNSATFAFSSDDGAATFECKMDSGSWTACTSGVQYTNLTDAEHTFNVRAIDSYNNVSAAATRTFTVDATAPNTTITASPAASTGDDTPEFSFTSSEGSSTFECRVDAGAWTSCSSPHTTATLADGAHTFNVRATDTAGNTDASPADFAFTVDTAAPDTTITVNPGAATNDVTPTFSFTASEGSSTFQCKIDAGSWTSCSSPHTTGTLADGAHTFSVRATDTAGNTDASPADFAFTVDAAAPDVNITAEPASPTTSRTLQFSFSSSDAGATFQCRVDAGSWTSCSSPHTTATLAPGSRTFSVRAVDVAGNTDAASRTVTIVAVPQNTTVPQIAGDPVVGGALAADEGQWTGTAPMTFTYQWQRLVPGGWQDISGATDEALELTAGDIGSTVRLRVTATNLYGAASAFSDMQGPVIAAPEKQLNRLDVSPQINGAPQTGGQLRVQVPSGVQTISSYWERCNPARTRCEPIAGATALTYTPTAADVGSVLQVNLVLQVGEEIVELTIPMQGVISFPDAAAPKVTFTSPVCPANIKKSKAKCKQFKRSAKAYRKLSGTVTDPAPSSGVKTVTLSLTSKSGAGKNAVCTVLRKNGMMSKVPCKKLKSSAVAVNVNRAGAFTFKLRKPLKAGSYKLTVVATDNAGKQGQLRRTISIR